MTSAGTEHGMLAYDPELRPALRSFAGQPALAEATLATARQAMIAANQSCAEAVGDRPISWQDQLIPGPAGAPELLVTVLRPTHPQPAAAGIYNIHGGGMMLDNRFSDLPRLVSLVEEFGCVAVTVEYRLAPEHPHPAPVQDCYAGLCWMAEHSEQLGFDPARLLVIGGSAGGGLAAGVSLLARDLAGPAIAGQLLLCPMIDDRNDSPSTRRFAESPIWSRASNTLGWRSLLGDSAGSAAVSGYAAPARAAELAGLPAAFVEVGAAEIFLDEDVEYARRLWQAGVPTELHVWAGAYHGFDRIVPLSELARAALAARSSWIRRTLGAIEG
ncbi:MAG: alpha/beta hydrolase [Actinomycetota bacterium]|nr:alpha/beta hydrolase [Actinomycetota bacterium]MDQ2955759.1 alpha/beta hydrolase [Actinomycetota bacterium]